MTEFCKSYIQVNIFGKTLQQLRDNNTDLHKILMNIGCDQIWLGDMPLYLQSSGKTYGDVTSILNTSLSDDSSPKHSTPQTSRVPPPNLSSIITKILSKIGHSSDDLDIQPKVFKLVANLLKSVVDIICETETQAIFDSFQSASSSEQICSNNITQINIEKDFELDTLILSTTINQDQKFPRCSTPRDSRIGRILTLGASLSKIASETSTEEFLEITGSINQSMEIIMENNEETEVMPISDSFDIQNKDIDVVSDGIENDLSNFEDCGNASFQVASSNQQDLECISNLLKSVVDIICETETECDFSILEDCQNLTFASVSSDFNSNAKSSEELPMFYGPHPAIRHSEIETKPTGNIVETKPRILTNQSVQNLKIPEKSIENENEKERKPLKRTISEIRRNRRKAMKLLRNNTVVPNFDERQYSNQFESKISIPRVKSRISEMDYDNLSYQSIPEQIENQNSTQFPIFDDSERVFTDLTPFTSDGEQYCEIEQDFFEMAENRLNSERTNQNEDSLMYNNNNNEDEDGNEQESWVDQNIELDLDEEEEEDDRGGNEEEDGQNDSLLKKKICQSSLHLIKCEFEGCKAKYKWRPKYGKLRLLDHSIKHCPTDEYDCNFCDFKSDSIRAIRAHENVKHVDKGKMNVKEVLKSKISHEELKIIWEKCYKENLHLVGKPNNYSC
ncbi:unnamed protein product [Caenorhabditis angaria]|uniref:Uncharacterized protein n=1 Tax=Caenorhabditis angaria TaxID=860376 RepID=A0A9P1I3X9_9PELO|nr:unnamed protein product [Caenorhabditis angaria]